MVPLKDRLTEGEAAYLAGIFDGEGTVGLYNSRNRHESTVMITNTDPRLMLWIKDKIGYGCIATIRNSYHRRKHVVHHWRICNRPRVKDFLEAIIPYLIVKKDQAELLLSLWQLEGNKSKVKITPDVKAKRDYVMEQLKYLKTSNLELAETPIH